MSDTIDIKALEQADTNTSVSLDTLLASIPFNEQGLIPAIAQDSASKRVLMLAWMDATALKRTAQEGYACYYSRSRQAYWRKGETSGHVQKVQRIQFDCDADTVLLLVEQSGAACHTHRHSCFYLEVDLRVDAAQVKVTSAPPQIPKS